MPKQKITKEMVVDAAFSLVRAHGLDQITVKDIAQALGCSVQPIYSYCESMDGLRQSVIGRATTFIQEYLAAHIDPKDFFRSTGYAYVTLAKEEPHLFQLFILHQRSGIASLSDLYEKEAGPQVAAFIAKSLDIRLPAAQALHLNMLIYTVGIGTILATTDPGIPLDEITSQLERAHGAFLSQTIKEEKENYHAS